MTNDLLLAQVADGRRARIDELERQLEEAQAEVARLNDQVKEWSKANLGIVATCVSETKRADEAERQLAEAQEAVRTAMSAADARGATSWSDIEIIRAALQGSAPAEGER